VRSPAEVLCGFPRWRWIGLCFGPGAQGGVVRSHAGSAPPVHPSLSFEIMDADPLCFARAGSQTQSDKVDRGARSSRHHGPELGP
jgi:hypothetical protein